MTRGGLVGWAGMSRVGLERSTVRESEGVWLLAWHEQGQADDEWWA